MIKRVEVNYRGIFQKNLGKKIGSDIVMIASRMGQKAFSNSRYSDSPERNGIPCKWETPLAAHTHSDKATFSEVGLQRSVRGLFEAAVYPRLAV